MNKKSNNYAFIDGQNLYCTIRDQGWSLDYRRFRVYLQDKYNVSKVFLFMGYIPTNQELYTYLQSSGYILILKPTLALPGKIKGNVDAELVLQAMIEYPHYDRAVIVAGDGDFHCLVKYLKGKDKLHKLLIPDEKRYSVLFKEFLQQAAFMNNLRGKLEYIKKERH